MSTGVRLADQGCFWLGVTYEQRDGATVPDGTQVYVEYQVPEERTQPYPVVLVHGGGGQAVDWISTPDGRPGWRTLLLQRGYAVYLLDRPGHGRSPRSLDEELPPGPAPLPSAEFVGGTFAGRDDELHTQWPGSGDLDDPALGQFLASQRLTPFDRASHFALVRERGGQLLDRIGPAIVVSNSAGGPVGWLMADERPGQVKAIVSLEPVGPSGRAPLPWGLANSPLTYDPPATDASELAMIERQTDEGGVLRLQADPARRLPNLVDVPIAVVSSERSPARHSDAATVEYLRQAGCDRVEHLRLADLGVKGNGHLMMLERNNEAVLDVVTAWLQKQIGDD